MKTEKIILEIWGGRDRCTNESVITVYSFSTFQKFSGYTCITLHHLNHYEPIRQREPLLVAPSGELVRTHYRLTNSVLAKPFRLKSNILDEIILIN